MVMGIGFAFASPMPDPSVPLRAPSAASSTTIVIFRLSTSPSVPSTNVAYGVISETSAFSRVTVTLRVFGSEVDAAS